MAIETKTFSRGIVLPVVGAAIVVLLIKTFFGFHVLDRAGGVATDIRQSVEHRLLYQRHQILTIATGFYGPFGKKLASPWSG